MSKDGDLLPQLKDACRHLIVTHIAYEKELFDNVWDAFWQTVGCSTIEELQLELQTYEHDQPIVELGAIGEQDGQTLDSFFAIAALLLATANLLKQRANEAITFEDVSRVLNNTALRNVPTERLRRVLSSDGIDLLAQILDVTPVEETLLHGSPDTSGHAHVASLSEPPASEFRRQEPVVGDVYFETKTSNDALPDSHYDSLTLVDNAFDNSQCDITIDEIRRRGKIVKRRKRDGTPLGKPLEFPFGRSPGGARAITLLCLAMMRVGRGSILYKHIRSAWANADLEARAIHQFKGTAFKQLVGKRLTDLILEEGGGQEYGVRSAGWSFLWIRRTKDETELPIPLGESTEGRPVRVADLIK